MERVKKCQKAKAVDYRTILTSLGARAITFLGVAPANSATIDGSARAAASKSASEIDG